MYMAKKEQEEAGQYEEEEEEERGKNILMEGGNPEAAPFRWNSTKCLLSGIRDLAKVVSDVRVSSNVENLMTKPFFVKSR